MKIKKKRSYVVIGLGHFGGTVAHALSAMGDDVLGIDVDENLVRQYSKKLSNVVIADARDEDALREAGVGNYDVAVIAIGEDLEANILATMNTKLLSVKTIWVKAQSNTHQRILGRIGVDRIIRPERDMGMQIAEVLHTPHVSDYIKLGFHRYLVNFEIQHSMASKPLSALSGDSKGRGWEIVGIMRKEAFIPSTSNDTILQEEDYLLALGSKEQLRTLSELL